MLGALNNLGSNSAPAAAPSFVRVTSTSLESKVKSNEPTFHEELQKRATPAPLARPQAKSFLKNPGGAKDLAEAAPEEEADGEETVDPRLMAAFQAVMPPPIAKEAKVAKGDFEDVEAPPIVATTPGRSQDLQRFLSTMQDKLGVRPDEIVKAFAQLSDRELAQAPALSANHVVENLNLSPSDARVAKNLLADLITTTNLPEPVLEDSSNMVPLLATAQSAAKPLETLPHETKNLVVDFVTPQPMSERVLSSAGTETKTSPLFAKDAEPSRVLTNKIPFSFDEVQPKNPGAVDKLVAQMRPVAPAAAPQLLAPSQVTELATPAVEQAPTGLTPAFATTPKLGLEANQTENDYMEHGEDAPSISARSINEMLGALKAKTSLDKNKNSASGGEHSAEDARDLNDPALVAPRDGLIADAQGTPSTFASQLEKTGPSLAPVTVPELMKNAQILIKDGGGEMKVTMHPEGLGEIAMKVSVEHGKVNVTMLTQSDETKQVIERQLGDLRSSLAGTHLHAGEIKVGVMSDSQPNLDRQFDRQAEQSPRDHQNPSQSQSGLWERGGARDQGQRRAYQSYGEDQIGQSPASRALAGQHALARTRQIEGARRLNLVA